MADSVNGRFCDSFAEPPRYLYSIILSALRQHYYKLLPAIARADVNFTHGRLHHASHVTQRRVTRPVPVRIVYAFQVIEVEKNQ
jgi:hypothetical protein